MIYHSEINTPIGKLDINSSDIGIFEIKFLDRFEEKKNPKYNNHFSTYDIINQENDHIAKVGEQLEEYFAKKRKVFDVPLDMQGTSFQISVWNQLMMIPYGKTISYEALSRTMKVEKAIRAIANANARNKIPIIIPCHRVIGKNGNLTGFAGGLWRKKYLIELENELEGGYFDFE